MPLEGPDAKFCVVLGCKNTGHEWKLWTKTRCTLHGRKFHDVCGCQAPFMLHPFPEGHKLQKMWLSRIGLPELEVTSSTCVCSIHFVEGKPTTRSYFPTLYLQTGLELSDNEDDDSIEQSIENYDPLTSGKEKGGQDKSQGGNNEEFGTAVEQEDEAEEYITDSKPFGYDGYLPESEGEEEMEMLSNSRFGIEAVALRMEESCSTAKASDKKDKERKGSTLVSDLVEAKYSEVNAQRSEEDNDEIEFLFHSRPQPKPVASYDAQAQTLQISNPVKYIQECHSRIAQLVAEKEQQKSDFEKHHEKLKTENRNLKRKILKLSSKIRIPATAEGSRFRVVPKKGTNKVVVIRKDLNFEKT